MTVSRIWHAFGLQPHRTGTFKLSHPLLIEKVRDIAGLYINPDHALVLCVDERARFRLWIELSRFCPCNRGSWSAARMTISATGPLHCLPRWT